MRDGEESGREAQALRDRLSRLSDASLRISESLDVDTVLGEVAESTRALTGAGRAVIATMDGSGGLRDFVSAGLSAAEHGRLLDLPYGPELWTYLRELPGALRLGDLAAHLGSLGFPEDRTLARSFLGRRSATGASGWAASTSSTRKAAGSSRGGTRRSWCCSPRTPGPRSPMRAPTATSSGRGPTWRR